MTGKSLYPRPHPNFPMSHPGAILAEAVEAMELSKSEIALRLGVTRKALYDVLGEKSAVTAAMALRLEAVVGSSAEFWLGLQTQHDLWKARQAAKKAKTPAAKSKATSKSKRAA